MYGTEVKIFWGYRANIINLSSLRTSSMLIWKGRNHTPYLGTLLDDTEPVPYDIVHGRAPTGRYRTGTYLVIISYSIPVANLCLARVKSRPFLGSDSIQELDSYQKKTKHLGTRTLILESKVVDPDPVGSGSRHS